MQNRLFYNHRFTRICFSFTPIIIFSVACTISEGFQSLIPEATYSTEIFKTQTLRKTLTPSPKPSQNSQSAENHQEKNEATIIPKTRKTPSPTSTTFKLDARPTTIGYSVAGRPIQVFRFGYGTRGRMIVAGVHGGYEWNTIALADQLIEYLNKHPEIIPQGLRLYILRALNPDGEVRSRGITGRANENGVDINRNFPEYWQLTWHPQGCWSYAPISAGTHPASEPETRALIGFINSHQVDALISYHSAGLGIFPGGRPPDPASTHLAETIAAISPYPYPPISGGCEFTGQMADWMSARGIAAVDIELTNHEDIDFDQNLVILRTFLSWEP